MNEPGMRGVAPEEALRLWQETLGVGSGKDEAVVERLRSSYRSVRERAALLAERIAVDLPGFTVHDMRHLHAVWDLADKLRGERRFNPLEVYVFGVALLIHDLGMGVAAYPGGVAEIRADRRWADAFALSGGVHAVGSPGRAAAERDATAVVLRTRHAEHAEGLAAASWAGPNGPEFLIDDSELRDALGAVIGRLAASHGRSTDALLEAFPVDLGAPADLPSDWRIDALSLGALLRVADAANVDGSRAPAFDDALHQARGVSREHWDFQSRLARPYVNDGSLTFTSTQPFKQTQSAAWWLAYETLRMVDDECASVDRLLRDHGRQPLAAAGVRGAATPRQLAKLVQVDGWIPIDASIYVGDVAALVGSLGGANLYGARPWVALRELLQNASDAVLAHRALGGLEGDEGRIVVGLERHNDYQVLSISDDGVGMSERVILLGLLNFGRSFWDTTLVLDELPGLSATGFRSTGRYGIGFFSAFMLGPRVVVTSRALSLAPDETVVLEFGQGVAGRPVLRPAAPPEQLRRPGTKVEVWLRDDPVDSGGLLWHNDREMRSLGELCGTIFPAPEVDLIVRESGVQRRICKGGDWRTLPGPDLLSRIAGTPLDSVLDEIEDQMNPKLENEEPRGKNDEGIGLVRRAIQTHLRSIHDENGRVVGRASILPSIFQPYEVGLGVLCVGGLRAQALSGGIAGIFLGEPLRAARDAARPLAASGELGRWATEQADLIGKSDMTPRMKFACASAIRGLGGDVQGLPVCLGASGWMTEDELRQAGLPSEIVLVFEVLFHSEYSEHGPVALHPHVFATEFFADESSAELRGVPRGGGHDPMFDGAGGILDRRSLGAIVAEAAAASWGVSAEVVARTSEDSPDGEIEIGVLDGRPFTALETIVLRRPQR